ncbi:MAG: RING finger protein [Promethearchaeota archaeon]
MLSFNGWIDGISFVVLLTFGLIIGIFFIYESQKSGAKLLTFLGLANIFFVLIYLGNVFDFFTVLISGRNLGDEFLSVARIGYVMSSLPLIFLGSIGINQMISNRKIGIILFFFLIVMIVAQIYLVIFSIEDMLTFIYPENPGEELIQDNINPTSPGMLILTVDNVILLIFLGFGFLYKGFKSESIIKKKSYIISLGFFILFSSFFIEAIFSFAFLRILIVVGFIILYYGLREEPEEKIEIKKTTKVEGDLFRIAHFDRDQITEKEVSISKEKKICIVCKGNAIGFNIYICPECETVYCQKCANTLISMENACWVCEKPIDQTKPSKPFQKREDLVIQKEDFGKEKK